MNNDYPLYGPPADVHGDPPPLYTEENFLKDRKEFFTSIKEAITPYLPANEALSPSRERPSLNRGQVRRQGSSNNWFFVALRPSNGCNSRGPSVHIDQSVHHHYGVQVNREQKNRKQEEKKKQFTGQTQVALMAFSALVAVIASYSSTEALMHSSQISKKVKKVREFNPYVSENGQRDDIQKLFTVMDKTQDLMDEIKRQSLWQLSLRVTLVAAAALVFLGAAVNVVNVAVAGAFLGLAGASGLAVRYAIDTSQKSSQKNEAREIKSLIDELEEGDRRLVENDRSSSPPYQGSGESSLLEPSAPPF